MGKPSSGARRLEQAAAAAGAAAASGGEAAKAMDLKPDVAEQPDLGKMMKGGKDEEEDEEGGGKKVVGKSVFGKLLGKDWNVVSGVAEGRVKRAREMRKKKKGK